MHTHKVIRPFPAQEVLFPGKLVDASGWHNRDLLVEHGYIEPLTPSPTADPSAPVVTTAEDKPVTTAVVSETAEATVVAEKTPTAEGRRPRRRQG